MRWALCSYYVQQPVAATEGDTRPLPSVALAFEMRLKSSQDFNRKENGEQEGKWKEFHAKRTAEAKACGKKVCEVQKQVITVESDENPTDGGAWWAAVHGVARSRTRLSDFAFTFPFHALEKEMATHSSVLAWRIPGTGEPGGLPSLGSHSRIRLKRLSSSSSWWWGR